MATSQTPHDLQPDEKPDKIEHPGWHSRGYLPHFDAAYAIQSVTFRLADSLPRHVLERMRMTPIRQRDRAYYQRIEEYLDTGYGKCYLRNRHIATIVQDALLHFDVTRYCLHAWVIMPNHVHVLLTVFDGYPLGRTVQSWKSFTANEANRLLARHGQFWYREYFDRYIRDDRHFANVRNYIHANPVKAGLAVSAEEWPFSSAYLSGD